MINNIHLNSNISLNKWMIIWYTVNILLNVEITMVAVEFKNTLYTWEFHIKCILVIEYLNF